MKRQTVIALGVAIILGLIAVFLANTYLSGRERQLALSPEGMVKVAVASVPLNFGDELTPEKVRFVSYPKTSLPPGIYSSLPTLLPQGKKRVALRPIQINQPLLSADLSGEGQNASLAAVLPDGMRAATVRINDVSGVAGFVKPNDTVDVLITRQAIGPDGAPMGEQVTDVLLQNVRIIAMGGDAAGNNEKAKVTRNATLEVTPVDAQKLVLGEKLGSLSFVLRKPGEDQNIGQLETVSLDDLRYSYMASMPPGARPAVASARPMSALLPTPAERQARVARLTQPRRAAPVRRSAEPAPPSTNTVSVTRGVETKDYEVGGYAH